MVFIQNTALFPGLPVSISTRSDEDVRGFVPNPSGRGTVDILTSCLFTLIICLWTSLHLNVPPSSETSFKVFRRKLKWMFFSAIAPEIMAAHSLSHYFSVKARVKKINSLPQMSNPPDKWTMTDGFYAEMGGFVIKDSLGIEEPVDTYQIISLIKNHRIPLPTSSSRLIEDKSKADGVSKLLSCLQASWFLAQCLARVVQHLPLTILELSTIPYVFFTIIIYASLWHKPLDVRVPTYLHTSVDIYHTPSHRHTPIAIEGDDVDKPIHYSTGYLISFSSHRNIYTSQHLFDVPVLLGPLAGAIYGGWHCLAWNFFFPTHAELLLWRGCAIATAVSLPFGAFAAFLGDEWNGGYGIGLCSILSFLGSQYYVFVRVAMIVEMFIGLRLLPVGAFETVRWLTFVPHV